MRRKLNKFLKCERGTQMIEFALLLPFLILLFASAVEMGRMFYTYTTLQKSTEVGARYLSSVGQLNGSYLGGGATSAANLVVCGTTTDCTNQTPIASNLIANNVATPLPVTNNGIRYVTVTVTYQYVPLVFDLGSLTGVSQLSLRFTFTPSTTMRYML